MDDTIFVFGHKKPDLDSTAAPTAWAWYLNKKGVSSKAIMWGKPNNEAKWVFEKFDIEFPEIQDSITDESKVVILDTTEGKQLPDNIEEVEVLEIIDHHKLGGLSTSNPLKATIDAVGCTSTLIYEKFVAENIEIDKNIAGVMLSAIISDTLNRTSPTYAERDGIAIDELAKIAGVTDVSAHAAKQFEAKSSLEGMDMDEVVNFDAKDFDMKDRKVKIGVFETVDTAKVLDKKEEIKKILLEEKENNNYDYVFYFAIDIMKNFAVPLVVSDSEKEILSKAYDMEVEEGMKLEGVVSRKKQMVPNIEGVL